MAERVAGFCVGFPFKTTNSGYTPHTQSYWDKIQMGQSHLRKNKRHLKTLEKRVALWRSQQPPPTLVAVPNILPSNIIGPKGNSL